MITSRLILVRRSTAMAFAHNGQVAFATIEKSVAGGMAQQEKSKVPPTEPVIATKQWTPPPVSTDAPHTATTSASASKSTAGSNASSATEKQEPFAPNVERTSGEKEKVLAKKPDVME
jgi:hypothetical protein